MANKTWTKLTKKQKAHLKECKITSKYMFTKNRQFQKENDIRCFECEQIARDLGVE